MILLRKRPICHQKADREIKEETIDFLLDLNLTSSWFQGSTARDLVQKECDLEQEEATLSQEEVTPPQEETSPKEQEKVPPPQVDKTRKDNYFARRHLWRSKKR